ncbi:Ig-like domain-containing protein [Planctomycetota bacterium]
MKYDASVSQLEFAAQEINAAFKEVGKNDVHVALRVKRDESSPEAYTINVRGRTQIEVIGTDANGAMYGGLEVADLMRLGLAVENMTREPFVKKRGIKFNIPLDARTPCYDDTGDAARINTETVWNFEFWQAFLDDLARYRYNVLSLWSTHPYTNFVKLEDYPKAITEDVYRVKKDILQPHFKNKLQDLDQNGDGYLTLEHDAGVLELVKKMTIGEKIAFWQKVFQYAEERGIEIYIFSWNVFTFGATGKHGIVQDQTNETTIDYMRKSVAEMVRLYPQLDGIGVCAGENDRRELDGTPLSCEHYIYKSFGKGIEDALKEQPDRKVRFIHRKHSTKLAWVMDAFENYKGGQLDTCMKYAVGHMYSSRRPQLWWQQKMIDDGWLDKGIKVWLNLRNDDIFMHRWGSPDFVRETIKWMPHDHIAGFVMGSDGYVWGREFVSKNPAIAGQLEIEKHWYRFRLWGQMAYNIHLGDDYWQAVLKHRFPTVDVKLLHDSWETVSEIVPQLNRSTWASNDADFAPEGCMQKKGFLTAETYYFKRSPMVLNLWDNAPEPQCISVEDWAEAFLDGNEKKLEGITPLQIADNLDRFAQAADGALPQLKSQIDNNDELKETLLDIESMAHLGRYYADKMRGAAKLAMFRAGAFRGLDVRQFHTESVKHFEDAVEHWKDYAKILDSHYYPSLTARTHFLNWNDTLKHVIAELDSVREQGDYPDVAFVELRDGDCFSIGEDLRVTVKASDKDGLDKVKLYVNGLLITPEKGKGSYVWSSESDGGLKHLEEDFYLIEAFAFDKKGNYGRKAMTIQVGNPKPDRVDDWKDEIHHVFLEDGGVWKTDKNNEVKITLKRLECTLKMTNSGKVQFFDEGDGTLMWLADSKTKPGRHHALFKDGRLRTYTGWPGRENHNIWNSRTPESKYKGPFKLGATRGKNIVCFTEENGKQEIVWEYLPNKDKYNQ